MVDGRKTLLPNWNATNTLHMGNALGGGACFLESC